MCIYRKPRNACNHDRFICLRKKQLIWIMWAKNAFDDYYFQLTHIINWRTIERLTLLKICEPVTDVPFVTKMDNRKKKKNRYKIETAPLLPFLMHRTVAAQVIQSRCCLCADTSICSVCCMWFVSPMLLLLFIYLLPEWIKY